MPAMNSFAGGWVLRTARHLYQPNEVVDATNLVPDVLGNLTTRMGMSLLGTIGGANLTSYDYLYSSLGAPVSYQAGIFGSVVNLYKDYGTLLGSSLTSVAEFLDFAQYEEFGGAVVWSYIGGFVDTRDGRLKKVDGVHYYNWGIKQPSAAPSVAQVVGGGALSAGTYTYRYVYVRKTGSVDVALSNPHAGQSSVAVNLNDQVSITNIHNPADPADSDYDPQVTHVRIYRSTVNTSSVLLFEQDIAATGTGTLSATSSIADTALSTEAIEVDNALPPTNITSVAVHKGRLFYVDARTNTLGFTKRFFLDSCPASFTIRQGTSADPFVRVYAWNDNLFVFSRGAVWRLLGDDENTFLLIRTDAPTGTDSPWSVSAGNRGIYYKGFDGLYLHTGGQARNISEPKIAPLFHYSPVNGFDPAVVAPLIANTNVTNSPHVGGWFSSRYYLSYATVDLPDRTLIYDENTDTFYPDSRGIRRFFFDREAEVFVGVLRNGQVMRLESGMTDNGTGIPVTIQTRDDDENAPISPKQLVETVFDVNTNGAAFTVELIKDYADTAFATMGAITTTARGQAHLSVVDRQYEALAWGYRITGTGPFTMSRIIPQVHLFPQNRISFDLEDTDLGYPGPKHLQSLWIDLELLTATSVSVTMRKERVAQPTRTITQARLPQDLLTAEGVFEATLFGLTITADGKFRIWDFRLGWTALPYERRELALVLTDLGWQGKKILQWLTLDVNVIDDDPVTAEVICDTQTFQTITLTAKGRQHTGRVRLPRGAAGFLIGFTMKSAGRFQTYPGCAIGYSRIGQIGEQQQIGLAPLDSAGYQQTNLLQVK